MNLLLITNLYPPISRGGYEQESFDATNALRELGHNVSVLTSSSEADQVVEPENSIYRLLTVRSDFPSSKPWRLPVRRLKTDLRNARMVHRLVDSVQPDVIVVYKASDMGRALMSTAERLAPVIYRVMDSWLIPLLSPYSRTRWNRLCCTYYDQMLRLAGIFAGMPRVRNAAFCSYSLRNQYASAGVDVQGSTVIHPGIPIEHFYLRRQHILQKNGLAPRSLLYVGRICEAKGVGTLVEAVGKIGGLVGRDRPTVSLVGPVESEGFKKRLLDAAAARSVELEFLGARGRSSLPTLYQSHDVLVFPSEWAEPFGLVLVEAMAMGLPVVTSLRGAASEIVDDGRTAIGFEASNAGDLADKISWVLTHRRQSARIGQAASVDVAKRFGLHRYISQLESYLHEVVSRGSRRARPLVRN